MNNKNYIPENIYDMMAVERLKKLPFETVIKDVPKLLEWLQDSHWDMATEVARYLVPYVNEIKQELLPILNGDDNVWKYSVMILLIERSPYKLDSALIETLKRIAEHPTQIETDDGVDDAAKMVIANKRLCG